MVLRRYREDADANAADEEEDGGRKALVGPYLNGASGSADMGGGPSSGTRRRRRKRSGCGGRATANNVAVVRRPSSIIIVATLPTSLRLYRTYLHNLLADIL